MAKSTKRRIPVTNEIIDKTRPMTPVIRPTLAYVCPCALFANTMATMEKGRLAKSKNKDIMPRIMLDKAYSLFTSSICLLSIAVPQ